MAAVAAATALLAILGASALHRFRQPGFDRGLSTDEFITLQNYTWAGVRADGTRRELERLGDIQRLGRPSPGLLAIGAYCSLGRWTEPNNHAIYSLIGGAALPLADQKVVAFRSPALLAAVAFAGAMAAACWRCGWYFPSVAVGAMAFWHPYVVRQSQEARGYSLMLLLVALFLIASEKALKAPASIPACAALVLISVLLFQNTVNMAADWVAPCYLLLIALPGLFEPSGTARQRDLRRKSLVAQALVVGLAGFIFLMDRLPYVYSAARQYGAPFRSTGEFLALLRDHLRALFPSPPLIAFALLGCVGMGIACRERPGRGYLALSGFAALATLLHFALGGRFSYERNLGHWLVPVLLGYACLGQRLIDALRRPRHRLAAGTLVYAGAFAVLVPGFRATVTDPAFEAFRARAQALPRESGPPSLALLGPDVASTIRLEFPDGWSESMVPARPGHPCHLLLVEKGVALPPWPRPADLPVGRPPPDWPGAERVVQEGPYSITRLPCRVEGPSRGLDPERAVFLWCPAFEAVAVSPENALRFLDDHRVAYHPITTRYQAKLDVFGRLSSVVAAASNPEEVKRLRTTFEAASKRFGGQVLLLVPDVGRATGDRDRPPGPRPTRPVREALPRASDCAPNSARRLEATPTDAAPPDPL